MLEQRDTSPVIPATSPRPTSLKAVNRQCRTGMLYSCRRQWKGILLTAGGVALLVTVVALGWTVWPWLGRSNAGETNSATLRNVSILPLAFIGIGLTVWRIMVAEKTLSYNQGRDRTDTLHSRYADASARLSSDSASARLGAIYELDVLTAEDPEALHVKTMKILCAFVRFPPPEARLDELEDDDPCSVRLRPDVQVAMEVIGNRTTELIELETADDYMPDLRQANLVRLELREGNLSSVDMRGSRFWGADLMRVNLSNSELQYTDFASPWVVRGQSRDELTSASGTFIQKSNSIFSGMTLLIGANFAGSRMLFAKFSGANLQGAVMSEANLPDTKFDSAFLYGVDFSNSELSNADLSDTYLTSVNLTGANLREAILSGTDLSGFFSKGSHGTFPPKGLAQTQIDHACADPDNPPKLDNSSGLTWNPGPCPV